MKLFRCQKGSLVVYLVILMTLVIVSGCARVNKSIETQGLVANAQTMGEIERYAGDKSKVLSSVYTTEKEFSLTFNGMGDEGTILAILDELDKFQIKATFFLPGIRVAEEPSVAKLIVSRGHEIENNTLNHLDMSQMSYEQVFNEVKLANDVIRKETGVSPKYLRTRSGEFTDNDRLVAAQLGMESIIHYTINPKDREMQDAESIGAYVERFITRGAIILLNTDTNPEVVGSIKYIAEAAEKIGYQLIPLGEMIDKGGERKKLEEIVGFDALVENYEYETITPNLFYKDATKEKVVALTFDDWASDKTVNEILKILHDYDIKSTFFLIGQGVENNPNLARAIYEEGHEIANHSYSHKIVTEMSPDELQKDIIKGHQVLTEAIQHQPTLLFRPATGAIDEESAKIITATGYSSVALYDLTSLDWDIGNSAQAIVQRVMDRVQPGSVLVMHILDGTHTAEALPQLIEKLRAEGYSFVKMSEMME